MTLFHVLVLLLLSGIFLMLLIYRPQKPQHPPRPQGDEIQIGVPDLHGIEFVTSKIMSDGSGSLDLELPGGVAKVGSSYMNSILPIAVVGIDGGGGAEPQLASLHLSEGNIGETDEALAVFRQYEQQVPTRFSILVKAEVTYEDIVAAVEDGRYGNESPLDVELRMSMQFEGQSTATVSDPFKGKAVVLASKDPGGHTEHSEGKHLFDCHAHWYSTYGANRYTLCHGPCTVGTCLTWWNRKQWENGWNTCSC